MTYEEAKQYLSAHHQEHLLRYYDAISDDRRQILLTQIAALNLDRPHFQNFRAEQSPRGHFEPPAAMTLEESAKNRAHYRQIGLDAIAKTKLGAVLLAGGQGTRLGFDHPKGMFNIGRTRTLYIFECLIENLKKVCNEAHGWVPLMIMTSESNDQETREFLSEHAYFGYRPESIRFFQQENEPVLDENGKILLKSPYEIVRAPNGNGGWFSSMDRCGLLKEVEERGIEWLNVFAVDNVLQQIADPVFLGAVLDSKSESGGKVVSKAGPDERVGVLCLEDGRPSIVEYYEMPEQMRTQRDPDGALSYRFGVTLNYLFRTDALLRTLGQEFPLHAAHKKVPYLDKNGQYVRPTAPNAYKFETLVLDMVHMLDSCLAFEVEREKEFAPVKNAEGADSVATARALLEKNGYIL